MAPAFTLITWNVAGRVAKQPEQASVLIEQSADLLSLQEVTARTLPLSAVGTPMLSSAALAVSGRLQVNSNAHVGKRVKSGFMSSRRKSPETLSRL
jgi:exonuclease III